MLDSAFLITAFATLFVVIDPPGLVPLYIALTQGMAGPQPPRELSAGAAVQWLLIEGWARGGAICMRRQMALFARWRPPSDPAPPA